MIVFINECCYLFFVCTMNCFRKFMQIYFMKLTYNCHVHVMDYGHVANDFSMLNAVLSALANCSTMVAAVVAATFF